MQQCQNQHTAYIIRREVIKKEKKMFDLHRIKSTRTYKTPLIKLINHF